MASILTYKPMNGIISLFGILLLVVSYRDRPVWYMLTASINKCTDDIAQCTQTQVNLGCFFQPIARCTSFALHTHTVTSSRVMQA
jgi:hypothetical protein